MTTTDLTRFALAEGAGSVTSAPGLPDGFTDTFTGRLVDAGGVRLHAVIGGTGPALLLVHGWPETWYAWRFVMPALARRYTVVAVDQPGAGLSEKPAEGYDAGTIAAQLADLMTELGHERFAVAGHDTGFAIAYALGADHSERVARLALAEIPGAPGTTPAPPLFVPAPLNDRLWHIPFNRVEGLPEQLIAGREDVYFGYEFAVQGGGVAPETIAYYIDGLRDPESLRGSLGFYRAWDASLAQNGDRAARALEMPVLAIGGERSYGALVEVNTRVVATDVEGLVIPGAGHWIAEEAPDALLEALERFLEPYRAVSVDAQLAASAR